MFDFNPAVMCRDVAILVTQQIFPVFVAPTGGPYSTAESMPKVVDSQVLEPTGYSLGHGFTVGDGGRPGYAQPVVIRKSLAWVSVPQ